MSNESLVAKDNWKHRSSTMRCSTCMWFAMKVQDTKDDSPEFGRCRRHAPTMNGYPAVFGTDWCGDHKMDENNLQILTARDNLLKGGASKPSQRDYGASDA